METQFTSSFWSYYIIAIVVLAMIGLIWLLLAQDKVKPLKKGEEPKTMGHEWDGIEEYNNPLPRWWFWLYAGTVVFAIGYLALYPGLGDYKGLFNWTSHNQYDKDVQTAEQEYGKIYAKYAKMSVEDVAKNPEAMTMGRNLFDTYCIQCHGSDAKGQRGFPNLTDKDWLWGGTPDKIHETISNGRIAAMPEWGPKFGEEGVKDVANYVISLSRTDFNADRAARGKDIFAANCAVCHGDKGQGNQGMAPNLTDNTWLWGSSEKAIIETITGGRHSQMPAWKGFLNDDKIHILTAYVWGISHKDNKALPSDTTDVVGGAK